MNNFKPFKQLEKQAAKHTEDSPPLFRRFITSKDTEVLNCASVNKIDFAVLAQHFWHRAFLFKRRWFPKEQSMLYDEILTNLSIRDVGRLKTVLEMAFYCADKALASQVKAFARLWLEKTTIGRAYSHDFEAFWYAII